MRIPTSSYCNVCKNELDSCTCGTCGNCKVERSENDLFEYYESHSGTFVFLCKTCYDAELKRDVMELCTLDVLDRLEEENLNFYNHSQPEPGREEYDDFLSNQYDVYNGAQFDDWEDY